MSAEKNRKRSLSSTDDKSETSKRRSICEETEIDSISVSIVKVTNDLPTENAEKSDIVMTKTVETNLKVESHVISEKSCDHQKSQAENIDVNRVTSELALGRHGLKLQQSHKGMPSVSDSVFSDGSVIRSVSEYNNEDSDDPLEEYETQYFGFTPKSFMNGVYNALAEYIRESLAALSEYIKQQYPGEMSASQLQDGEENLMKFVQRKLNRSFDILEQYLMTNVFRIPHNVVLPEDQVQVNNQYTEKDEKQLDTQIKQLEDKILTIRYANGILRQDLLRMDEVQGILDGSVKQLETMEEMTKESGVSDIRDSTVEVINRVKKLINIVQTLENPQS